MSHRLLSVALLVVALLVLSASPALAAECRQTLDDFNRPDDTNLGPNWTERVGDFAIVSQRADHSAGGFGLMTFNGGPSAPTAVCADIVNGFYAGLVLRYTAVNDNYFIKFQDGSGDGELDRAFFYLGNQTGSGATPGVHFITPFSAARVYATVSGTTVTVQIDRSFDGITDETISSTYNVGSGNGTGYGVVGFSGGMVDNFGVSNGAPAITTNGSALSVTAGDPATAVDPSLTAADAEDANLVSGHVSIASGFQSGDVLGFVDQNGISGSYDNATGVLALTGTATVADYEAALRSVSYRHAGVAPSASKTVAFELDDSFGLSDPVTRTITVAAVNAAPTLSGTGGTLSYTENEPAAVVDPSVTAADADDANLASARVRIASGFESGDVLGFADQNGISGSYDGASGVLSLGGSATVAAYQAALRSITYRHAGGTISTTGRSIEFTVNDGQLDSNSLARAVSITAVDDATAVDTTGPAIVVPSANRTRTLSSVGRVRFPFGTSREAVTGTISLKRGARTLGAARFRAALGRAAKPRIRLTTAAKRILARHRRLKVRATITMRDAAGNATVRIYTFALKARRR